MSCSLSARAVILELLSLFHMSPEGISVCLNGNIQRQLSEHCNKLQFSTSSHGDKNA